MESLWGLLFAFAALLAWGFGDFYIQRTARLIGIWKALFYIGLTGFVLLLPFAWPELDTLAASDWLLLVALGVMVEIFALLDFEAMRKGKLAVVQPVISLELPLTVIMSLAILGERISWSEAIWIILIIAGIGLSSYAPTHWFWWHRRLFERGVLIAMAAAVGMAAINLLVGVASRATSPLVTVWFTHTAAALLSGLYLLGRGEIASLWRTFRKYPRPIILESLLDNLAWVAYAFAVQYLPVAIVITITEAYIALSVILGVVVNREKMSARQALGVIVTVAGVIILSLLVGD